MTNFQYEVSPNEFQGVIAEKMEITPAGALLFTRSEASMPEKILVLAVAPGRWLTAFPDD